MTEYNEPEPETDHLAPIVHIPLPHYMSDPLMQWARFLEGGSDGSGAGAGGGDGDGTEGSGDGDGEGSAGGDGDGSGDGGDGDGQDPDGADALGDPGKRALEAMKTKNKALAEKNRQQAAELARLKAPKDGETLTEDQIRDKLRAEVRAELAAPLWRSSVRAAAAALDFHDPADAARFLDMSEFDMGDDGDYDADEIHDKLSELLGKKPWLAKTPAGQPGNGGGRKVPPPAAKNPPKTPTLDEQIAEARAKGDTNAEFALQMQKAAHSA